MIWNLLKDNDPWTNLVIIFTGAAIIGILTRFLFFKILSFSILKSDDNIFKFLQRRLGRSLFLFIPFIILREALDAWYPEQFNFLIDLLKILIILSFSIIAVRLLYVIQDVLYDRYDIDNENNLKARKVRTQIVFLRKIGIVIIAILAISLILLSFESVRKYGATLLTSAGVAGIVVGFAAQKTLANLLAGLQIAFTQPIRMDDAVVVEGEWGWVEEINLTYVVVKIWDMRRLVLPITYFTETPFQNWTRSSSQILGVVKLYVDYSAPLDDLRKEFERLLEQTDLWDGDVKSFQISDNSEKTMTLRLLMSARSSPLAWDLRCYMREHMIDYLQQKHPHALPKTRALLDQEENSKNEK